MKLPFCLLPFALCLLTSCQPQQPAAVASAPQTPAPVSTPTARTLTYKLAIPLDSPADLKVKQGDRLRQGQVIAARQPQDAQLLALEITAPKSLAVEQQAVEAAQDMLKLASTALEAYDRSSPYLEPAIVPRDEQLKRADLVAAIAEAKINLQTAQATYAAAKAEQRQQQQIDRLERQKVEDAIAELTTRSPWSGTVQRLKLIPQDDGRTKAELTIKVVEKPLEPKSPVARSPLPVAPKLAQGFQPPWTVTRISDGDTIRVRQGNRELRIRFCGIDAPESKQPGGDKATAYLRSLLSASGERVDLTQVERDRYGRTVAEVWRLNRGQRVNVNAEMTRAGWAYYYAQYAGDCPSRAAIANGEQTAKQQRLGVWQNPQSIPPWQWRRQNR